MCSFYKIAFIALNCQFAYLFIFIAPARAGERESEREGEGEGAKVEGKDFADQNLYFLFMPM